MSGDDWHIKAIVDDDGTTLRKKAYVNSNIVQEIKGLYAYLNVELRVRRST